MTENPNCDGSHCISQFAETRLYPIGAGGNLILCRACFNNENRFNKQRGIETERPQDWFQHDWNKTELVHVKRN